MRTGVHARVGGDGSFRAVKIKIPERKYDQGDVNDVMHRKRGLRFEKSQRVEFLPRKKKVDFRNFGCCAW